MKDKLIALFARHGKHHHDNEKFGYILLGISVIVVIYISALNTLRDKLWLKTGNAKKYAEWLKTPLWLSVTFWVILVALLAGIKFPDDYVTLGKRLARLSFSLLPISTAFTLRPSPLPHTLYLRVLPLHKWISRIAVICGSFHAIAYITLFGTTGRLHRLFTVRNFPGLVVFLLFVGIAFVSLKPIRNRNYQLFYTFHYCGAWICVILMIVHARPNALAAVCFCVISMAGQLIYRIYTSVPLNDMEITQISNTLSVVEIPRSVLPRDFPPGAHVRLSGPLNRPVNWITSSHPYTIATLDSDNSACLVVRKTRHNVGAGHPTVMFGPFAALPSAFYSTARQVVLVAGGSGISFAAPVVRALTARGADTELIWVVRDRQDVGILPRLGISAAKVFVTGTIRPNSNGTVTGTEEDAELDPFVDDADAIPLVDTSGLNSATEAASEAETETEERGESLETSDLESLLSADSPGNPGKFKFDSRSETQSPNNRISIEYGRPNLSQVCRPVFGIRGSASDRSNTWLVACGPETLVRDAEKWAKDEDVRFACEAYAL